MSITISHSVFAFLSQSVSFYCIFPSYRAASFSLILSLSLKQLFRCSSIGKSISYTSPHSLLSFICCVFSFLWPLAAFSLVFHSNCFSSKNAFSLHVFCPPYPRSSVSSYLSFTFILHSKSAWLFVWPPELLERDAEVLNLPLFLFTAALLPRLGTLRITYSLFSCLFDSSCI